MRGILFVFLVSSLSLQSLFAALPFTCNNTNDLEYNSLLDSEFTVTYGTNYFFDGTSIRIQVNKDASYDQSNVKGLSLTVDILIQRLLLDFLFTYRLYSRSKYHRNHKGPFKRYIANISRNYTFFIIFTTKRMDCHTLINSPL